MFDEGCHGACSRKRSGGFLAGRETRLRGGERTIAGKKAVQKEGHQGQVTGISTENMVDMRE